MLVSERWSRLQLAPAKLVPSALPLRVGAGARDQHTSLADLYPALFAACDKHI